MWAVILNSQSNQDNFVSRYISVGAWKYFGQCAEILWCAQKYFGVDKNIFCRCREIFWSVHGNIYVHIYAQHWLFGGRVSIRRETCLLLLTPMPGTRQAAQQNNQEIVSQNIFGYPWLKSALKISLHALGEVWQVADEKGTVCRGEKDASVRLDRVASYHLWTVLTWSAAQSRSCSPTIDPRGFSLVCQWSTKWQNHVWLRYM